MAELFDVLLGKTELHRFVAAGSLDGVGDLFDAVRGRDGNGLDRSGLTLGLVDGLLLFRFRRLDDLLLVAVGGVDGGVALPFGLQNRGAFLALGAHLLLHRGQHVLRRVDVLDLVAQHLHAPRFGGLVHFGNDHHVDVRPLFERAIELNLADLAAEVRLRQLGDGVGVVGDAV